MSLPLSNSIENPILQELNAVGGSDDVRFLYEKLIAYFPQITSTDLQKVQKWRKTVQLAGKSLDDVGLITRERGFWKITEKGKRQIESESHEFDFTKAEIEELTHTKIQAMLVEIGKSLNYYAQIEFEYYDVVWREKEKSPRLSHVFEVQSKGNIDSAFAKLKRAFDAQRSKPFLVLSTERDSRRAAQSLSREFGDLQDEITILSFSEVNRIYQNLQTISEILPKLLAK
ncbi:MAG: winged helix-turn-helix domain-containing protein [Pyrinomonadaceae bacterium]|nr:winged helix-turn-helix domain-containing protein [Pyrinomonadaceae bacterium]